MEEKNDSQPKKDSFDSFFLFLGERMMKKILFLGGLNCLTGFL